MLWYQQKHDPILIFYAWVVLFQSFVYLPSSNFSIYFCLGKLKRRLLLFDKFFCFDVFFYQVWEFLFIWRKVALFYFIL